MCTTVSSCPVSLVANDHISSVALSRYFLTYNKEMPTGGLQISLVFQHFVVGDQCQFSVLVVCI